MLDFPFGFSYNEAMKSRFLLRIILWENQEDIMKLKLSLTESAERFASQIEMLGAITDIAVTNDGLKLSCEKGCDGLTVTKENNAAHILFEKDVEFFRGLLTLEVRAGETSFRVHEKAHFAFNGEMLYNSRNSVLNMKTAKEVIMYSALLGLDNVLLYNEETFEVPEDPYFGYMRMGYSKKDVRELTDFAKGFGVTIVPCIQTLAHLAQTLRWACHRDICDAGDTLLVEEEKTYALIENIIKSWRDCVDTDIANIGMDEAFYLGRGQYMDKHGYKPHFELMCEHLKRVIKICKKYNFKPMIWSDMFFHLVFGGYYTDGVIDQELLDMVPTDVILTYWDYYSTDKEKYDRQIKKHLAFKNEIAFAGGAWKWSGIVPSIDHSMHVTKLALEACRENGISTVFTTAWGDNGAEASIMTILPVLALFAEISYSETDVDQKVSDKIEALTGYTTSEFMTLCSLNRTTEVDPIVPQSNPAKYLFFQDPLMGLFDYHVLPSFPAHFAACAETLNALANRGEKLSYVFDTLSKLAAVLELKCDLGVQLKAAYDADDKPALTRLADIVIPDLLSRFDVYYEAFRTQWYKESRPGGFDVQDLRFGGLKQRILNAQRTLRAYVNGEIEAISELKQKRLPFDCRTSDEGRDINVDCNFWNYISTPNVNSNF